MAEDTKAADTAAIALAERALVGIDWGAWDRAELLVDHGRSLLDQAHLDDYATNVLLYAVAARLAVHQGEVPRAHPDLAHAQRLRPQLTVALPIYAVQARLELVRAHLALTDVAGARTILREVDEPAAAPAPALACSASRPTSYAPRSTPCARTCWGRRR